MEVTDDFINRGEYPEALERTIWFHNHSVSHQKSISAVRLSFAIRDWYNFGKKYPPAMTALLRIRDKKTNIILNGSGSYELFDDVSAINNVLTEDDKTIDLYNEIAKTQPNLAKELWYIVEDIAIKEKQYGLLEKNNTSVLVEYDEAEESLKYMISRYGDDVEFIKMNKNIFIERSLELIELSTAVKDYDSALIIKNKASAVVSDKRLNNVSIN